MMRLLVFGILLLSCVGASAQPSATSASTTSGEVGVEVAQAHRSDIRAARATPARRISLPNGMVILLKEAPGHDLLSVELLCRVGLQNEDSPTAGLIALWSRILEDRLIDAVALEYRILEPKVSIEPDFLRFSITAPADQREKVLTVLSELVARTDYSVEEVDEKRKELKEEIESGAGPANQLYGIFRSLFYRYHPYRRQHTSGTLALDRITPELVGEFHRSYLVPNRLVLAMVGRLPRAETELELRDLFGGLRPNTATDMVLPWEPKAVEKRVDLSTTADIAWVLVGFQAPSAASEDHVPMMVLRSLLSEGLSSRLFNEIRERRGLSYSISSLHPDLRGPSHFLTYVVTRPKDVGEVRREVLRQVEQLQSTLLESGELEYAKAKVRGAFLLEKETASGTAFRLARAESIGLGYSYEENFERNLEKVTAQDIRRVAEIYLINPTVIVARPGGRFYWDG